MDAVNRMTLSQQEPRSIRDYNETFARFGLNVVRGLLPDRPARLGLPLATPLDPRVLHCEMSVGGASKRECPPFKRTLSNRGVAFGTNVRDVWDIIERTAETAKYAKGAGISKEAR